MFREWYIKVRALPCLQGLCIGPVTKLQLCSCLAVAATRRSIPTPFSNYDLLVETLDTSGTQSLTTVKEPSVVSATLT